MANPFRLFHGAGVAVRKLFIVPSGEIKDVSTSPTFTNGAGVPSATEPNGSLYTRSDATDGDDALYVRVAGAWVPILGATA